MNSRSIKARGAARRRAEADASGYVLPGLKVSSLPTRMVVEFRYESGNLGDEIVDLWEIAGNRGLWNTSREIVVRELNGPYGRCKLDNDWNFGSFARTVAPKGKWHPRDLPNPNYYAPTGELLAWGNPSLKAKSVIDSFLARLVRKWQLEDGRVKSFRRTERRADLFEELNHHHLGGGDPEAFREFVGLVETQEIDLPPSTTSANSILVGYGAFPLHVQDHSGLLELLGSWLRMNTPRRLRDQFRSKEQYAAFLRLLAERGITDGSSVFIQGRGQKGRLLGAYEGISENPRVQFSTGSVSDCVATLEEAFPTYKVSKGRPQDLRGRPAYQEEREAFRIAAVPLHYVK